MGEYRVDLTADPDLVNETLAAFQGLTEAQQENFMRRVVEVALTYKAEGDPAVLTQFAADVLATAELRRMPSYRRAFTPSPA